MMHHRKKLNRRKGYATILSVSMKFLIFICALMMTLLALLYGIRFSENADKQRQTNNQFLMKIVYNLVDAQHETFKNSQKGFYIKKFDSNLTMGEIIANYFHRMNADMPIQRQTTSRQILNFMDSIMLTSRNKAVLLAIVEEGTTQNIVYVQKSHALSEQYVQQAAKAAVAFHCTSSRRATKLFSISSHTDYGFPFCYYVISDTFRSYTMPSQKIGTLLMAFSSSEIDMLVDAYALDAESRLMLLNTEGQIVYSNPHNEKEKVYPYWPMFEESKQIDCLQGSRRIIGQTNPDFGFSVILESSMSLAPLLIKEYFTIALITLVSILVGSALFFLFFHKRLHKITQLLKDLSIAEHDISYRVHVSQHKDEIDEICIRTNEMLTTIQNNVMEKYIRKIEEKNALIEKREAELYALQSQINPHFLYNALELIRMQLVTKDDLKSAKSVQLLSKILRNRIKGNTVRTIENELHACYSLVEFYNISNDADAELEVLVTPDIAQYGVLQDILIPLLENIMTHVQKTDSLNITIDGEQIENDIILRVQDNGQGFTEAQLETIHLLFQNSGVHSKTGIGFTNLQKRLQLVYGKGYGLTIQNAADGGAVVQVRIAAVSKEELEKKLHSIGL